MTNVMCEHDRMQNFFKRKGKKGMFMPLNGREEYA